MKREEPRALAKARGHEGRRGKRGSRNKGNIALLRVPGMVIVTILTHFRGFIMVMVTILI